MVQAVNRALELQMSPIKGFRQNFVSIWGSGFITRKNVGWVWSKAANAAFESLVEPRHRAPVA
jgi:hypothetical protein